MSTSPNFNKFSLVCDNLIGIISETERRIVDDGGDSFFTDNINFFTKSYLINLCTYLESYLKEICVEYLECIKIVSINAALPHNLILWSQNKECKETQMAYKSFEIAITKKDIDDELSGNPFRTAKLFKLLGVNLEGNPLFQSNKDIVNSIISKRNKVIHYNDTAGDVALGDLKNYTFVFIAHAKCIDAIIWSIMEPLRLT